jgi:hypothetical protein
LNGSNWRKSTFSSGEGGQCVEVGQSNGVLVRDTKQEGRAGRTVVTFTPEAWSRFTSALR